MSDFKKLYNKIVKEASAPAAPPRERPTTKPGERTRPGKSPDKSPITRPPFIPDPDKHGQPRPNAFREGGENMHVKKFWAKRKKTTAPVVSHAHEKITKI